MVHIVLPGEETSFNDTGLLPVQKYYYRVHAVSGKRDSAFSNVASVTTKSPAVTSTTPAASASQELLSQVQTFASENPPVIIPQTLQLQNSPEASNSISASSTSSKADQEKSGFELTRLQILVLAVIGAAGVVLAAIKVLLKT